VTIPILHAFQATLRDEVYQSWNQGAKNVLMRLDTGGGKTVTLSDIVRNHLGAWCVIAHRQELIGQLSLTLAANGIRHNIVAAENTRRAIVRAHIEELGRSFYDPGARGFVASVDTLVKAELPLGLAEQVTLWVVDEGHHLVVDNKWHTAISRFTHPLCRGLLPTATPKRADRKGLGRWAHGVADVMVQGPPMRWLIEQNFLTDYRIVCPPCDLEMLTDVAASGDWSTKALKEAAQRSHIIGDVVSQYLRYAPGKLGITFSTDVDTAGDMTAAYRMSGVPAETLTGKTDDGLRRSILRRFKNREILQIVAVDIISEGFDLPAIEVASMARPTQSLALYMQQFGRTLRTMPGKGKALIIDHVANILRHQGPPDKPREWTLDAGLGPKSGPGDAIPYRVCLACYEPYERIYKECPFCGHYVEPTTRDSPAAVDGDCYELDAEVLARLRAPMEAIDTHEDFYRQDLIKSGLPHAYVAANVNRRREQQDAISELRAAMGIFGGRCVQRGYGDSEMQRLFWHKYGIDVISAQGLGTKEARALAAKIIAKEG
jgi:DNA repair protein RadD